MLFDVLSWKVEWADSSFHKISQSLHCVVDFPLGGNLFFLYVLLIFNVFFFMLNSLLNINKQIKQLELNPNSSQLDSKPSDHWKPFLWPLASLSSCFLSSLVYGWPFLESLGLETWLGWQGNKEETDIQVHIQKSRGVSGSECALVEWH